MKISPQYRDELKAITAAYADILRRTEADLRDIFARKAAVGAAALREAGFDPDTRDYRIDEETGDILPA